MDKLLSYIKSKKFVFIIVVLVVSLVIFRVGMSFGYRRAIFASEWGRNYYKNFYGEREQSQSHASMFGFSDNGFMGTNGAVGTILGVSSSTIAMKGKDNVEKSIIVNTSTVVRLGHENIKLSDLKAGDNIAVIGGPNSGGQIEAKFIRVFPDDAPPPSDFGTKQ